MRCNLWLFLDVGPAPAILAAPLLACTQHTLSSLFISHTPLLHTGHMGHCKTVTKPAMTDQDAVDCRSKDNTKGMRGTCWLRLLISFALGHKIPEL